MFGETPLYHCLKDFFFQSCFSMYIKDSQSSWDVLVAVPGTRLLNYRLWIGSKVSLNRSVYIVDFMKQVLSQLNSWDLDFFESESQEKGGNIICLEFFHSEWFPCRSALSYLLSAVSGTTKPAFCCTVDTAKYDTLCLFIINRR